MTITFTRTGQGTYAVVALRDDSVVLAVPSYDRTSWLPHDLAHFVVERGLGLKRGFWGCVAAGALFPGVKVLSGRQPVHAAARSQTIIREMGQQGTEAEVLVGILVSLAEKDLGGTWPVAQKLLNQAWRPGKPSRGPVSREEAHRVCIALRDAQLHWRGLAAGESLTVCWPLRHDHRS